MTVTEESSASERRTIYLAVGLVLLALLIVGLVVHKSGESTQEAHQKATQLIAALEKAGAHAPTQDQVVRVLGNDGGALCDDPSSGLRKGILLGQLTNGAAGPGIRPIIADNRVVKGQLLVLSIYCPDKLPTFQEFVNKLDFSSTIKG
jgi:hypothetical protein